MTNKGFSLIELIVVMVIMGALMAITVPLYNQWMRKNYIESQTRELMTDLNTARLDSIYRKSRHSIVLNPGSYSMKRYSSANENVFTGGTQVFTKSVKYQLSPLSGTYSGQHVVFNVRGFLDTLPYTIKVNPTNSGAAFDCIVVSGGRTNVGKVESNACNQK